MMVGDFEAMLAYFFSNKIGNCFNLDMTACLANDEKISHSFRYLPQVQAYNIFSFFLLDGLYYGFEDLTTPG